MRSATLPIALLVALAMAVAACGDAAETVTQPPVAAAPRTSTSSATAPPTAEAAVTATTTPTPTTSVPEATTTTITTTTTAPPRTSTTTPPGLPGEPYELFFPLRDGEHVGVVGVAHDDVLNVRALPGADQPIVRTLDPLARDFAATGQARLVGEHSVWLEIYLAEGTGWVHGGHISRLGTRQEVGFVPMTAPTLLELGRAVAECHASTDPEVRSDIIMSLAPRGQHDLGEVAFDVMGYADDSVWGARVHVYARPTDDRQAFELTRVVVSAMCSRGISESEGICV